jgi:glycosyltransferase involved in cell wall biosynthesis
MPRVIFIDRLIRGSVGHNLEVCLRLAGSFRRRGYDVVVLANSRFAGGRPAGVQLLPVLDFDFDRHIAKLSRRRLRQRLAYRRDLLIERLKARLRYSTLGNIALLQRDMTDGAALHRHFGSWPILAFVPFACIKIAGRAAKAARAVGRAAYQILSKPLAPVSTRVRAVGRSIGGVVVPNARVWELLRAYLHERSTYLQSRTLSGSVRRALVRLRIKDGDIIILPTMQQLEILSIPGLVSRFGKASWHFIFRQPIFLEEDTSFVATNSHRILREMLHVTSEALGDNAHFWTDTEELSAQYGALKMCEFGTLPIPLPIELSSFSRDAMPVISSDRPVVIGYLGDARPEKGYGHLPALAEQVACEKPRLPVNFLVQSNFNVPGGVPLTWGSRLRLLHMDNFGVRVIDDPQTSDEYCANVRASDVVLLSYTSPLYFAGSSGILAEALAAGRPVIATDRTWGGRCIRSSRPYRDELSRFADKYGVHQSVLRERPPDPLGIKPVVARKTIRPLGKTVELGSVVRLPRGCTHIVAKASFAMTGASDFLAISAEFTATEAETNRRRYLSGVSNEAWAILQLPIGALTAKFEVLRLNPLMTADTYDVEVIFCREQNEAAMGAIGLVVEDEADLLPAVRNMVVNYDHFRRSATAFARGWNKIHDLERFIAAMIGAEAQGPAAGSELPDRPALAAMDTAHVQSRATAQAQSTRH